MKTRLSLFIVLCILGCSSSIAQVQYIPAAAHSYCVSVGGGITDLFSDFSTGTVKYAGRVNLDYNINPFLSAGIEGQLGSLAANGYYINPPKKVGKASIVNNYNAVDANIRLEAGRFLKHVTQTGFIRVLGGIYIGTGIGVVNDDVTPTITRMPDPSHPGLVDFHNNASACFIPANVGINVPLPRIFGISNIVFNINGQENFVLSDLAVDGYHSPESHSNDIYAFISAALRFNFGPVRHY